MNKELETVGVDEYSLEEYCELLSKRTLSLLYQIDDLQKGKYNYNDIKKYIFNLAGNIERLHLNIVEDSQKQDKSLFRFLLKRGD
jgi:hypothetical protein